MSYKSFHSVDEAELWGRKYYKKIYELPPESDLDIAFQLYKGRLAMMLNNQLRGCLSKRDKRELNLFITLDPTNEDKLRKRSDDVIREVSKNKVGENIITYRFTKYKYIKKIANQKINVGISFSDKALLSTTLVPKQLCGWAEDHGYNCMLKIYVPSGTCGVYLPSRYDENIDTNECEFLMPQNIKLKIINIRNEGVWRSKLWFIDCVVSEN